MFHRRNTLPIACLILAFSLSSAIAQTPADLAQTGEFAAHHQNKDGGFGAKPGEPSTLGSTSSSMKILLHVGGSISDVPGAITFVKKCFDPETGGFAQTPGGKPDVHTTAVGLMAIGELRIADPKMIDGALRYFHENVKSFEDVRIAVAGLEGVKKPSDDFPKWKEIVNADRNADGTWGSGAGKARATGGAAAALLRMGVELDHKDAILAAMREGQQADGAWLEPDGSESLSASYRIMRCFFMLKEKPNIEAIQKYIATCRRSTGGYGTEPGRPLDLGGTYMATIILRWSRLLSGEPAVVETGGYHSLFNGEDLGGWEGDTALWAVRDGMIVGKSTTGLSHNDFLATDATYGDFVLKLTFRVLGDDSANSGVQFRSVRVPGHEMSGYQADVGQHYWGCLYDESRRNKVLVEANPKAFATVNKNGWNTYVIRAIGGHIGLTLNGVPSVNYDEKDDAIAREGKIALQMHAGKAIEVQFKDIYIQRLPSPKADDAKTPGFHLRTVKVGDVERKYSLFLPEEYDANKEYPLILFLHGAGERGDDGVKPTLAGIGPIIAGRPREFPFIVVFPQAKRTWASDSPDAKEAFAALDQVLANHKVDRSRIYLTGLSMGGFGSWQNAAAHPDLFAAVVPVCGFNNIDVVSKVKHLPIWTFVGDADSERILKSTRNLVAGLKEAGASPLSVEYRGVGHNSWDRATPIPSSSLGCSNINEKTRNDALGSIQKGEYSHAKNSNAHRRRRHRDGLGSRKRRVRESGEGRAHLFSCAAIDRVNTELGTLAKDQGVNVVIETTLTLDGIPVEHGGESPLWQNAGDGCVSVHL